jgi:aspartate 1-decarboxylase
MTIQVLKSKIHRARITQAELHYVGSITLDPDLMDAANLIEGEKVHILNINNGERLETYVITGQRGSGQVCINGPAARRMYLGDMIIVISYASMDFEEARTFKPWLCFPDHENRPVKS